MDDEAVALAGNERLFRLLEHYHANSGEDRSQWVDRVMDSDGDLTLLHGALLAPAWIEVNTSAITGVLPGGVGKCYRVTHAGARIYRRASIMRSETEPNPTGAEATAAVEPTHS